MAAIAPPWPRPALDTATRPLIVPTAQGPFGDVGTIGSVVAEGAAGTFAGLPVYTDANISTNVGLGTEDIVIVARFPDCYLWESELSLQSFDATYADQMSVGEFVQRLHPRPLRCRRQHHQRYRSGRACPLDLGGARQRHRPVRA